MKLYWAPKTRASRAVWLLEEAEVSYELVVVDLARPIAERGEEFLAASPMGKVPALADGEVLVADSAAIGLYLADRYAPERLAPPPTAPARGPYLFWMGFTPGVMEPAMAERFAGSAPHRSRNGWGDFDSMIDTLERALTGRPWLLGSFSAADVLVGSSVLFMQLFDMLPARPVLEEYAARCRERPAQRRAAAREAGASPG